MVGTTGEEMHTPCGSPTFEGVQGGGDDDDVEQGAKVQSAVEKSNEVEFVVLLEEEDTAEGEEAAVHENPGVQLGSDVTQEGVSAQAGIVPAMMGVRQTSVPKLKRVRACEETVCRTRGPNDVSRWGPWGRKCQSPW